MLVALELPHLVRKGHGRHHRVNAELSLDVGVKTRGQELAHLSQARSQAIDDFFRAELRATHCQNGSGALRAFGLLRHRTALDENAAAPPREERGTRPGRIVANFGQAGGGFESFRRANHN